MEKRLIMSDIPEYFFDPVRFLPLHDRTKKSLLGAGYEYFGDILCYRDPSERDFITLIDIVPGFGKYCLADVMRVVKAKRIGNRHDRPEYWEERERRFGKCIVDGKKLK